MKVCESEKLHSFLKRAWTHWITTELQPIVQESSIFRTLRRKFSARKFAIANFLFLFNRKTMRRVRARETTRKEKLEEPDDYRPLFLATMGYETGGRKLPLRFQILIIKLDRIVRRRNRETMKLRVRSLSLFRCFRTTMKHTRHLTRRLNF